MKRRIAYVLAALTLFSGGLAIAQGEEANEAQRGPMRGGRGHMMAAMQECLKSGKAMPECRQEMMKNHRGGMGGSGCPKMGQSASPDLPNQ